VDFFSHLLFGFILGQALQLDGNVQVILIVSSVVLDVDAISARDWEASFLSHRGPVHSILIAVLFSLLISIMSSFLLRLPLAAFIPAVSVCLGGLLIHIFFDLLTSGGIKVLWPFSNRKFSLNLTHFADPVILVVFLVASILIVFMRYSIDSVRTVTILALVLLTVDFGVRYYERDTAVEAVKQLDLGANSKVSALPTTRPDKWLVAAKTPFDDGYCYKMYHIDSVRKTILSRMTVESPYVDYRGSTELPIDSPQKAVGYSKGNSRVNALVEKFCLPAVHVVLSGAGNEWRVFWYDAFVQMSGGKSRGIGVKIGFDGIVRFETSGGFWQ
jgi:inner membrane protein